MITWVLGRGGLVGSSVEAKLNDRSTVWFPNEPIQWSDLSSFESSFAEAFNQFVQLIQDEDWAILWCAGNGIVSSSTQQLQSESQYIQVVCSQTELLSQIIQSRGVISFTSSAGGVYGGSSGTIFDENTIPIPINEYGRMKLETERQLTNFARISDIKIVIFRLANVYGPNQDVQKSQGIISAITQSVLQHKPIKIYVPLQTIRNYIYADDVGEIMARNVTSTTKEKKKSVDIKIIASDRNISLSTLLNEFRHVYGKRPSTINTIGQSMSVQPDNLRLRSISSSNDRDVFTPLAVGIAKLKTAYLRSLATTFDRSTLNS
jgi:UDP-glucose 4-epimerase